MKEFLEKHTLEVKIGAAVLGVIILGIIIFAVSRGNGGTKEDYFSKSNYPVTVSEKLKDGSLILKVDGSITSDLKWKYKVSDKSKVKVKKQKEKKGVLTAKVTPRESGYTTVTFSMNGKIKGLKYKAVELDVHLTVNDSGDGAMSVNVGEIYQTQVSAGALDTDNPFLLDGNYVLLPGGGDWKLDELRSEDVMSEEDKKEYDDQKAEIKKEAEKDARLAVLIEYSELAATLGKFDISNTVNDDGIECISVYPFDSNMTETDENARFVLYSKKLKIKQMIKYRINESGNIELMITDEKVPEGLKLSQLSEEEKYDIQVEMNSLQRLLTEQSSSSEGEEETESEADENQTEEPSEETEESPEESSEETEETTEE